MMIPKDPIELSFQQNEEFAEDPVLYINKINEVFKQSNDHIIESAGFDHRYDYNYFYNVYTNIRQYYSEQHSVYHFFTSSFNVNYYTNYKEPGGSYYTIDYENDISSCCD